MKGWKHFAVLIILSFISSSALAASVAEHNIKIVLKEDDSAHVVEEYWLLLQSEEDKTLFEGIMAKESFSLDDWKIFQVEKTIVLESTDENIIPEKTGTRIALVKLEYDVPEITETIEPSGGRKEAYGITEKAFSFYDENSKTISFPQDPETELTIMVPQEAGEVKETTPEPYSTGIEVVEGKQYSRYTWDYKHPFTSQKFRVSFEREVSIQSRLSVEAILQEIRDKYVHPVYIAVMLILLAIMVWYRKELGMLLSEAFAGEAIPHEEPEKPQK